jgi:dihydroorotate dehydrogenase
VQLGSVLLHDPGAVHRVAAELTEELATRGIDDPADAVGVGHLPTEGTMP